MAGKIYITEYASVAGAAALEPPITTQTVTTGAGSTQSNLFNVNTRVVRVHSATITSVLFGTNPTADANSPRMAAGQTEYFRLPSGNPVQYRLAGIDNT